MNLIEDGYGKQLLAQYESQTATAEFIERDDNYLDTGSEAGFYFTEYEQWSPLEQQVIKFAAGRVLDIGCGAGRHSLYLQQNNFDVTAIDNSPGAIEVCQRRGLLKTAVKSISEIGDFAADSFETILMLGNNFGLFGDAENAKLLLGELYRTTSADGQIIAGSLNPYQTGNPNHLEYLEFNRQRGRMSGQIRMRVRFGKTIGAWFDYLFVSPEEMQAIVATTDWRIKEFIKSAGANYFAILDKNVESRKVAMKIATFLLNVN